MYLANPNADSIIEAIDRQGLTSESVVMILLAEKSRSEIPELIRGLKKSRINFCGGVFPGVIHGDNLYDQGAVMINLPALEKPLLVKGLDSPDLTLPEFGRKIKRSARGKHTAIILVDGWASYISLFLSEIFNRLGNSFRYFGGGAGSLSSRNKPCIFTPEGEFQNAALIIFTPLEVPWEFAMAGSGLPVRSWLPRPIIILSVNLTGPRRLRSIVEVWNPITGRK